MTTAPVAFDCAGIRAYWMPDPRETAAALIFRIGTADETLPTHGIGATVCRLALYGTGKDDDFLRVDSFVDTVRTAFWAGGSLSAVCDTLRSIAGRLRNLPTLNLAAEQQELLASPPVSDGQLGDRWLLATRYGPRDYGLEQYHRFGLSNLGPEDIQHWADQCFTASNAVLWFTGPEQPPPLDLGLGLGTAFKPPPPHPIDGRKLPGYITGENAPVGIAGVVRRGPELALTIDSLTARVAAQTGRDGMARQIFQHLDDTWAHAGVLIERPGDNAPELLKIVLATVEQLADEGVSAAEIDAHRRDVLLAAEDLTSAAIVDRVATAALLGEQDESPQATAAILEHVSPVATAVCARELIAAAIVCAPTGTPTGVADLTPIAPVARAPILGTDFHPSNGTLRLRQQTLTVGEGGITLRNRDGTTTITDADLIAVLRFPLDHIGVIGVDETYIAIDPMIFGPEAIVAILKLAGHARTINTPELRAAENVLDLASRTQIRENLLRAIVDSIDPELAYEEVIAAEHSNQRGAILITDREFQFVFSWRGEPRVTALAYADIENFGVRRRKLWIQAAGTRYANQFELEQPAEAARVAQILERKR